LAYKVARRHGKIITKYTKQFFQTLSFGSKLKTQNENEQNNENTNS